MKWLPLLLFAAGIALAESQPQKFPISAFDGGLNSNYSGLGIADNEVQDSLNVYFDGTFPVEKREGYTLCGSTDAVSMDSSWSYSDAGNNGWLIIRKPTKIIASNQGCTFTVTIATVSASDTINAVNAFGNIYFTDRTQGVYSWNGTSTTYSATSPRGSLIAEFRGRLWVSGLAHPNGNQLYSSGYLDGSNWTLGSLTTSPVLLTFGLNDSYDNITSIFSGYNDSMQIFKNLSIYALYGFDQLDFEARILNREVGCIDNRSVQPFLGGLVFASRRGIEFFDGVTVQTPPISDKVGNLLNNNSVTTFSELSWTQTLTADFNAGYVSSVTTTSDQLKLSTNNVDNVVNNSLESWSSGVPVDWTKSAISPPSCTFLQTNSTTLDSKPAFNGTYMGVWQECDAFYRLENVYTGGIVAVDASSTIVKTVDISTTASVNWSTYTLTADGSVVPGTFYKFMFKKYNPSTVTHGAATDLRVYSSSFSMTNDLSFRIYVSSDATFGPFVHLDYLTGGRNGISSGIFYSAVKNAPNITSFGSLSTSQQDNGGTQTFYMRSSTSTFTVQSSTPAWVAQGANTTISIATGTYFQVRDDFAITSATQTPTLNDFSVSWREGTPRQPMASVVADKRYFLSFSTSTDANRNTAMLVLTKGPVWSFWSIAAGSLLSHRGAYYFTNNVDNGKVYTLFSGTSDDTAAINSYVKTKDFALADVTQDKLMDSFYLIFDSKGATDITTKYFLDRQATEYSLADVSQDETDGLVTAKLNFPLSASTPNYGKTISFKIGSNDTEDSLALYGGILNYRTRMTQ